MSALWWWRDGEFKSQHQFRLHRSPIHHRRLKFPPACRFHCGVTQQRVPTDGGRFGDTPGYGNGDSHFNLPRSVKSPGVLWVFRLWFEDWRALTHSILRVPSLSIRSRIRRRRRCSWRLHGWRRRRWRRRRRRLQGFDRRKLNKILPGQ